VLAWYSMRPVLMAFINPKLGKFNVTAKGGVIEEAYFDWGIARPYLILLLANLVGFAIGVWQLTFQPDAEVTTLVINMIWTSYNIILSSASLAVASESRQVRVTPRVAAALPAAIRLENGKVLTCQTDDFSQHGLGLTVPEGVQIPTAPARQTFEFPGRRDGHRGARHQAADDQYRQVRASAHDLQRQVIHRL
jgi:cellulose synthase (UDP-forming)